MAIGIVTTEPDVLRQTWLHVKLFFVLLLVTFHFYCGRLIHQLENKTCYFNSLQMRRINEIPTILLGLVVLFAIFKNNLPTSIIVWGTVVTVLTFGVIIQLYAHKRSLQKKLGVSNNI
ncbi:CopD family protein [Gloeocapsopsis crepidinum]|uniref:CopD family protein n=1 Tax=Gloeocapsopsis crepidinum TaxID=693223 RepID=UPI002AD42EDC|nr:CopD family protein [Gloeocapsopsis crepidinum]